MAPYPPRPWSGTRKARRRVRLKRRKAAAPALFSGLPGFPSPARIDRTSLSLTAGFAGLRRQGGNSHDEEQHSVHCACRPGYGGGRHVPGAPVTWDPTLREALARLRQVGIPQDFLTNCYVVDEEGLLLGLLTVRALLTLPERARLDQSAEAPKAVLAPQEDQERAAALLDQLEVSELPVADGAGRLVGTFTAEDALGVLKEEATEDMERMAAIQPSERPYLLTRVLDLYRHRVVWLLLLMISASFTGAIITYFEDALAAQVALTAFIPMLMDTGGNCGSQSSVTVIRSLSLGELRWGDWWRASWKELQVGVLCGVTLALVNLARLTLFSQVGTAVALVVSLTLIVTVVSSKLLGCLLPIAASRLGLDPAVMASPLITTIADAVSLLVYFRIAVLLLAI